MKPLTAHQKHVLVFVGTFVRENGYAPSLREIAKELKTSNLSTAQYFIEQLAEKGYLKKDEGKTRGITLLSNAQTIPLLGYIAAGKPIEPIENPEDISVPENIKIDARYPYYALRVKGDSMIDMGVLDGDIALIRHQLTANNGDAVVAITENGATLKIFKKRLGTVTLEPRNKDYPNIIPKKLEIRGKFIGLIRNN
jgi:repressor LexA